MSKAKSGFFILIPHIAALLRATCYRLQRRKMIGRVFKIFSLVWITGWLLTWTLDIKGEYEHPEDYSIILPTGESQFSTGQFVREMIDHGIGLFLFWPGAAYLEVGVRMGWICKSAEIGRC